MKKYVFYVSTIIAASIGGNAWGENPSCVATSDLASSEKCVTMGYKYTTTDCNGKKMLKCPFDDSKIWCQVSKEKTCEVGDVLFNNKKCYYDLDALPKTNPALVPVAVVFDATNKLAIDLYVASQGGYLNTSTGYTGMVYSDDNGRHGRSTTSAMSEYCGYSGVTYKIGKMTYTTSAIWGCKPDDIDVVPDDANNNTPASTFRALKTTSSNKKGWLATLALVKAHGEKAYDNTSTIYANPAKYCYDKNQFDCCVVGGCNMTQQINCESLSAGIAVKPWFLPSVGDLFTLKDNLDAVNEGIGNAGPLVNYNYNYISDDSLHTTTLASTPASQPKNWLGIFPTGVVDYIHSWAVRRFNQDWGSATSTGYYVHDNSFDNTNTHKTRCVIYYGTGWTVPNKYYVSQAADPNPK